MNIWCLLQNWGIWINSISIQIVVMMLRWWAGLPLLLPLLVLCGRGLAQSSEPMFQSVTETVLPPDNQHNPTQLNYGMAVTDVDGDGDLEVVVAG